MKHIILIILFALGIWAQEIGVPYVDTYKTVAQSAALSPDGKTFYTYANNTLTHWSLKPIKMLDSEKIKDAEFAFASNIYVSPNGKKIIFTRFKRNIGLYDLKLKKFTKKYTSDLRTGHIAGHIVGSDLLTINSQRLLTIYDANTLEKTKEMNISEYIPPSCDECSDRVDVFFVDKDQKKLVVFTGLRLFLLDSTSFEILYQDINVFPYGGHNQVSLNRQKVIGGDAYYDIKTNQIVEMTKKDKLLTKICSDVYAGYTSQNHLSMLKCDRFYNLYDNQNEKILYTIHFFGNNEYIFISPDGYFDGSTESRKYLYMITPSGESVPIDDATYNKYHKQITIESR